PEQTISLRNHKVLRNDLLKFAVLQFPQNQSIK
ncbi:MAG: hypothetical protein ACI9YR_000968, partial [Bacteroidia bacterium]